MPTILPVVTCAMAAALFWSLLGAALGRALLLDRPLVVPLAPVLGFAVHGAVALPLFMLIGFSRASVTGLAGLSLAASLLVLMRHPPGPKDAAPSVAPWMLAAAALVALAPAAAILPKLVPDGVVLAAPLYDHTKVAIVDEIARLGVPPGNPFYGPAGAPTRLVYYYLWHFSAAELAVVFGIGGWGADAALTAVTAFASLSLMLGLAVWLGARRAAGLWVLLLCLSASLRPVLKTVLGSARMEALLQDATGLAGWLFQAAWAPQHLASASCVVLAVVLLVHILRRPGVPAVVVLALVVVAAFEASAWIGGITFALAAPISGLALLVAAGRGARLPFLARCLAAAVLALALAAPFLRDQLAATTGPGGLPLGLAPYEVLGPGIPEAVRRLLDWPAYWLVLLPIEFPAIAIAGAAGLVGLLPRGALKDDRRLTVIAFAGLAAVSLVVTWLFVDTLNENNDLAWRAVLPGLLLLTVFAAVAIARWSAARAWLPLAAALALFALGIPDGVRLIDQYTAARPQDADEEFASTPELWAAVRRHAGAGERVANDPLFFADVLPWPVNASWALLADRRSCFAGAEWAKIFIRLPAETIARIDAQFVRVFAGQGTPDDVRDLAQHYDCRAVVVTPDDGAWENDPFAGSPYYQLAEAKPDAWRIYRVRTPPQ